MVKRTETRRWLAGAAAGLALLGLAEGLWAQDTEVPERGLQVTGSYRLGDIETVNTKNGNVMLGVPLASLPPGRGGSPGFQLTLNYNSKLWDLSVQHYPVQGAEPLPEEGKPAPPKHTQYTIHPELRRNFANPGWHYSYEYRVHVEDRRSHHPALYNMVTERTGADYDVEDKKHWYVYKVWMVFPDGSAHLFRPEGERDLSGCSMGCNQDYFRIAPTGWKWTEDYSNRRIRPAGDKIRYYSVDGSYLRLEFETDGDGVTSDEAEKWTDNRWTLYFPDGRRVEGEGVGKTADRLIDRNGNKTTIYPVKDYEYNGTKVAAVGEDEARTTRYGYDFHTGQVTSVTDDNGVKTVTELDDAGRPIVVTEASGKDEERQTRIWYCEQKRRLIERSDLARTADREPLTVTEVTDYDRLGREHQRRSWESGAPEMPAEGVDRNTHCSAYPSDSDSDDDVIKVKMRYQYVKGGMKPGFYSWTSNPYREASDETVGWTRTRQDQLGRAAEVGHFSGSTKPSASAAPTRGKIETSYDAELTTVTDPADKKRRSRQDGLGRLVRVDEPVSGGALTQQTSYSYDTLDNLTQVIQGVQTRTFGYDSLSRLTKSTNPESGTTTQEGSTTYTYDDNGNLTEKTDPRGVKTSYSYDGLNRLTERRYSYGSPTGGQADPAVNLKTTQVDYAYDNCGSYSRGRLCRVTATNTESPTQTEIARTVYEKYDALGRVGKNVQTTGGKSYTMSYAYDLAGNLISQTYPSNRVVKTDYDLAGRAAGVWETRDNVAHYYAGGTGTNAVGYEPHGGIRELRLGNGLWEQRRYNARLQPVQIGLGTATTAGSLTSAGSGLLLLDYSYGTASNNGNVVSQRIRAGTLNVTQSYSYDELNRLTGATERKSGTETWSQDYGYDRYGNRRVTGGANHGSKPALTPQSTVDIDTATNRLAGTKGVNLTVGYDRAGNLTADWSGRSFEYDGDNRMVFYDTTGADSDTTYSYDGEGRRVRKVVGGSGGTTTIYVYNAAGQLVAEYTNPWRQETGTRYLTADHLGSTRLVTGEDQGVLSRHDYLPFGEEIGTAYGGRLSVTGYTASRIDGPTQKFTGKERDTESQLDYFGARYFGGAGGRFTSVDPIWVTKERMLDPQRLNLFAYGRNNPLLYVDPLGMDVTIGTCEFGGGGVERCFEYLLQGLREEDRAHVNLVQGDGKNRFKKGEYGIVVNQEHTSDSKNFQALQKVAGDRSGTARIDVLEGDSEFQVRVDFSTTPGEHEFKVESGTVNSYDVGGYTFFPPGEGVPGPYSTGDFTNVLVNASRGWIPSTMHHEIRHVLVGDFGRQAPHFGQHGTGRVGQETREADKEAVKNHIKTLK